LGSPVTPGPHANDLATACIRRRLRPRDPIGIAGALVFAPEAQVPELTDQTEAVSASPLPAPRSRPPEALLFGGYQPPLDAFDELFEGPGRPRPAAADLVGVLDRLGAAQFRARKRQADGMFRSLGVTFGVYADGRGSERIFPFDPVPRVIDAADWARLERGLVQRVAALNAFLADVYGAQRMLAAHPLLADLALASRGYLAAMRGVRPRGGVYVHISGIDVIRGPDGRFAVLEDNIRTPSGVSYVLENRVTMKRHFPELFRQVAVRPVDEYPTRLRRALDELAPPSQGRPGTVVLTPGPFNSAYFEHCFLARRMGTPLVQASDLFVSDDRVYTRTTTGAQRVHVIYRRVDDDFLDPTVFRSDSVLGVPGLVRAYALGHVTLANAVGNGVADDKAVYPFVPDMIRYYLGEEPLLDQVETYICARDADRAHVLANLESLVVKAVDGAGGVGMLMGPQASQREIRDFADRIRRNPRGYIAQPLVELSASPTYVGRGIRARRVDLRPFVVSGAESWVLPGGLTRVALRQGSYVVNSSQGGGSKDTWVLGAAGG
jgi:uncharacterized circularly permuted ATP-grasp superfamily protein